MYQLHRISAPTVANRSYIIEGIVWLWSGPVFCLLLGLSSDYAQPITGQVTEVTCPVIGRAQPELTPSKRQKTGPDRPSATSQTHYVISTRTQFCWDLLRAVMLSLCSLMWLIYPCSSRLLHCMISCVTGKLPWGILVKPMIYLYPYPAAGSVKQEVA